jgi:LmbE family N-acetylglucosaminyl deacetylase
MGVKHVVMLGYPDGGLDPTREFLGDVVRAIRTYRPHTVFTHDPYRIKGFQHRDHRAVGITTQDAVTPTRAITCTSPITSRARARAAQGPRALVLGHGRARRHRGRHGRRRPADRGPHRHESQMPGFNVPRGETIGQRVKDRAKELAEGYDFTYGAAFRR